MVASPGWENGGLSILRLTAVSDNFLNPARHDVQHLVSHFGIFTSRARRHMKRMVGILNQLERCAAAKLLDERLQQVQTRQLVTGSLQEEHRYPHLEQVFTTLGRWSPGRVQGEPEEYETAHSGQRFNSLCLGSHPAAERLASGEKRKLRLQPRRI